MSKVLALISQEKYDDLTPAEKKKYDSKAQQYYLVKVLKLKGCCEKFEKYLNATVNEPTRWHLQFKEIFKDYLNSKKTFSRTNSLLKDMYKKLKSGKQNWEKQDYYKKIFGFKPKLPDKKGYIKRSAIDDKTVAEYFNKKLPKAIAEAFNRHNESASLDAHSATIVAKYLNLGDIKNLEKTNTRFEGTSEKLKHNPVPLTKENRKVFKNIETQYVYSPEDQIFNDGK